MTQWVKTWLRGVAGGAAGLGLALGVVGQGGAVNAATGSASAAAAQVVPGTMVRLGSLGDQVENADQTAVQAIGGGQVVAIQRVAGSTSEWVVTVDRQGSHENVWVNDVNGHVVKTALGMAGASAIR